MIGCCRKRTVQRRKPIKIPQIDNRSAFFWDAGLLTACHESRDALVMITRSLHRPDPSQPIHADEEQCNCGEVPFPQPRSMAFRVSGHRRKAYFRPSQDLFTFALHNHAGDAPMPPNWGLTFSASQLVYDGVRRPTRICHIGLEYEPTWWDGIGKRTYAKLIDDLSNTCNSLLYPYELNAMVWLIERSSNLSVHGRQIVAESDHGSDSASSVASGRIRSRHLLNTDSMRFYDMDMEYSVVAPYEGYLHTRKRDSSASFFLYYTRYYSSRIGGGRASDWLSRVGILQPTRCLSV